MGIFRGSEEQAVRDLFAKLEREVELVLVLGPEETPLPGARDIDFAGEAQTLVEGLAELGALVSARVTEEPELGIERFPAIAVLATVRTPGSATTGSRGATSSRRSSERSSRRAGPSRRCTSSRWSSSTGSSATSRSRYS
jgi:hypothetical protein